MKKIINLAICTLIILFSSCADYLDIVPDGTADIDYAFRDRVGAEKFLATCYHGLPDMGNASDIAMAGSNETFMYYNANDSHEIDKNPLWIKLGRQNASSPYCNYWGDESKNASLWKPIRNCNIFLENIDKVGRQLDEYEKMRWVAEVKTLKAFYHFYLLRLYGPIPLKKISISVESSTEDVRVYRDTFDDCVAYIDQLLEEAIPDLPSMIEDRTTELGRLTKSAAMSLRADLWMTAASPLFNGNKDYKDVTDNRGVKLFPQTYSVEKWEKTAKYAKEALEEATLNGGHTLYEFDDTKWRANELSDQRKLEQTLKCAFSSRWNSECIWALTRNTMENMQFNTLPFLINDDISYVPWLPRVALTFAAAENFYTINGVPIDEDKNWTYNDRYKPVKVTKEMNVIDEKGKVRFDQTKFVQEDFTTAYMNTRREFRYYANVGFDGGYWWGNGNYEEIPYALRMKQGEVSGKQSNIRYFITGLIAKKIGHVESVRKPKASGATFYRYNYPIYRLADLYLMCAEAMNEAYGPSDEAYSYLNVVRERAGLEGVVESWQKYSEYPNKPKEQEGFRDIIRNERNNELCMEGKHYWDMRRWKTATTECNAPVKTWNIVATTTEEYYQVNTIDYFRFSIRDYLSPIKIYNMRVNPNLVQNPYWE